MRILIGIFLGVILTVAGAYAYDSQTGRAPNGLSTTAAGGQAPMVNWDVVGNGWQNFQASVRSLTNNLKRHTG